MGALSYIPRSRPQGEGLGDWTLPCQFKEMWDSQGPSLVLSWVSVCLRESQSSNSEGSGYTASQPWLDCSLCTYHVWHPEQIIKLNLFVPQSSCL